ncbi:hypothetical protein HGRIS_011727 [Hohenbuehelia grisea]|uniref:Uncharacterized protein n=1 Tax=Hohenbuehelia grisea TaxID=104357 RepID=A0ABR3JWZ5_9AGAR
MSIEARRNKKSRFSLGQVLDEASQWDDVIATGLNAFDSHLQQQQAAPPAPEGRDLEEIVRRAATEIEAQGFDNVAVSLDRDT